MPTLRAALFTPTAQAGYAKLTLPIAQVKPFILNHPEFTAFKTTVTRSFDAWRVDNTPHLQAFGKNAPPKALIDTLAEALLNAFNAAPLLDAYDVYQHLMDYWAETMQDDAYLIAADGWVATPQRIIDTDKKGKTKESINQQRFAEAARAREEVIRAGFDQLLHIRGLIDVNAIVIPDFL